MSSPSAPKRPRGSTNSTSDGEPESDGSSDVYSSDDMGAFSDEETVEELRRKLDVETESKTTLVAKVEELNAKINSLETAVFNLGGNNEKQAKLIERLKEKELKIDDTKQKLDAIADMIKDMPKSTDFFTAMGGQLLTAMARLFEIGDENDVIGSFTAGITDKYSEGVPTYGQLVGH